MSVFQKLIESLGIFAKYATEEDWVISTYDNYLLVHMEASRISSSDRTRLGELGWTVESGFEKWWLDLSTL